MITKTKQKVLEKGRPSQKEPRVLRSNIANKGRNGAKTLDQNIEASVAQSIQQARERHAMLVDRKFKQSLTPEEQLELESVASLLDKAEKSFYEPIIQQLRVERDKLLKHFSGDRRKAA